MSYYWSFRPYVSVAQRRAKAMKHVAKLVKKGRTISPVQIEGRTIARTFWGKAWCDNLESYSDFENRLPRGRTYVRNGSVIDLQIEPGLITAIVSGSEIYNVEVKIKPLAPKTWKRIKAQCGGQIASVIALLQGRLTEGVMQIITRHDGGMFPAPAEISMDCSCPDWAGMCKHIAAVLYGVGARLDQQPELLFKLRKVDHLELIEQAANIETITRRRASGKKTIAADKLADVFDIELDRPAPKASSTSSSPARKMNRKTRPTAIMAGKTPVPVSPGV
jgi:uncharacterized Zn finger protein